VYGSHVIKRNGQLSTDYLGNTGRSCEGNLQGNSWRILLNRQLFKAAFWLIVAGAVFL
jgi:hypothetical protein